MVAPIELGQSRISNALANHMLARLAVSWALSSERFWELDLRRMCVYVENAQSGLVCGRYSIALTHWRQKS